MPDDHDWWVVTDPTAATDADANRRGLTQRRDLFQLRVTLPLADAIASGAPVDTRSLRPGTDDESAWINVNNRAFADHPDQGDFTLDRLHDRMAEPWFDAAGFRLHERGGRLAAFCWTKIHADVTPTMGEIYVIGVDPDFQGLGLGRSMTVAGLSWLADHGQRIGMLYVDALNTPAVRLYESLGFTRHHTDRVYSA